MWPFNPNGDRFASVKLNGTVQLWSHQGALLKTLGTHKGEAWTVEVSPDNTYLVSGSSDNTAKVWSPDGQLLHTLTGHQGCYLYRRYQSRLPNYCHRQPEWRREALAPGWPPATGHRDSGNRLSSN